MVKETLYGRKCSNCGHNGHNARTCNVKASLRLFGVRIVVADQDPSPAIKRSVSMGQLELLEENNVANLPDSGYKSDGDIGSHRQSRERKKGKPWSEEEHIAFLAGLQKLGKGDWRGISKTYVTTRTPTQVASHAQKHFLRQCSTDKKKRRSSLFDLPLDASAPAGKNSQTAPSGAASVVEKTGSSLVQPLEKPVAPSASQGADPAQIVNRFPHLCLDRPPVNPNMAPGSWSYPLGPNLRCPAPESFAAQPYPMRMEGPRPGIPYFMAPNGVSYYSCAPMFAHPSGIPSWPGALFPLSPSVQIRPSSSTKHENPAGLEVGAGSSAKPQKGAEVSGPISVV